MIVIFDNDNNNVNVWAHLEGIASDGFFTMGVNVPS